MREDLIKILREGADLARAKQPTEKTQKGFQDFVTNVDLELDAFLKVRLGALTSGIPVLSEEGDTSHLPSRFWMVDPIDGTANLISGLPFVGIAVAFIEDGTTTLSGVADIYHGSVYSAAKNNGAFLDEMRLKMASAPAELLGVSSGLLERADIRRLRQFGKLRGVGSQALQLCMVASGQLGATLSYEAKLWDDVAAALIAQEAGATYIAYPEGDRADNNQRSACFHPAHADKITAMMEELWRNEP